MKRRLDLAMTLVSRPRVIFLDEPTTGLDPRSRRDLWQIVRELLADGVTIFLTTQYLEEADQLAHTVGLLDGGRLVATGTPAELKAQAGGETLDDVFLALTGHARPTDDDQNENGAVPMSTMTYAVTDSVTMLRRNLKHLIRYPSLTLMIIGMPVVFLLLFVYVFGGTMGAGLPGGDGDRADYLTYITPTILVMTVAAVANSTAILIAMDATEGIIDRFRTMPIARSAPLNGHVLAAMAQTILGVLVVLAIALALGYRGGSVAGWAGAAGMLVLMGWAMTWLSVALGLASGSVEAASNAPMPLILLPFLSSGFVPTDTMPTRAGLGRRAPALHADHRHAPRLPRGPDSRLRRLVGDRLVRPDHRAELLVGRSALRAGSGRLTACSRSASWRRTPG